MVRRPADRQAEACEGPGQAGGAGAPGGLNEGRDANVVLYLAQSPRMQKARAVFACPGAKPASQRSWKADRAVRKCGRKSGLRRAGYAAASQGKPSGSVKVPAVLPSTMWCEPVPSAATPRSLARARRLYRASLTGLD